MDIEGLIEIAKSCAFEAGKAILQIYEQGYISYEKKEGHSPVTLADKEANRIISNELTKTGIPILSEEGRDIPFAERQLWNNYWLVDPLDGTKEFISRNGEFTVNIALMSNANPVAGVIYAPYMDKLFFSRGYNEVYKIINGNTERLLLKKISSLA